MKQIEGYVDVDPDIPEFCNIAIQGEERAGKDDLACSWPAPVIVMPFDRNYVGPVRRWRAKGKKIITPAKPYFHRYNRAAESQAEVQGNADAARAIIRRWRTDFRAALLNQAYDGGTIVIDTEDKLWENLRLARFGKLTKVPPVMYQHVNAEMLGYLGEGTAYKKHVIWLRRLKEEWINTKNERGQEIGRPTGKMKPLGFKETSYEMQASLRVYRNLEMVWCAEIEDCTLDGNLAGVQFEGKERHFKSIYPILFGQKKPRQDQRKVE